MSNNETLADIAREMRTYFQAKKRGNPEHRPWHQVLSDWADRIEAAAKREAAIHAMTCEANERLREHLEIALEGKQGNAAAMHMALEAMLDECCNLCDVPNQMSESGQVCNWRNRWSGCQCKAIDKARAALVAPPRNCDRFANTAQALGAYPDGPPIGDDWDDADWMIFLDWLFTPAEGGGEALEDEQ